MFYYLSFPRLINKDRIYEANVNLARITDTNVDDSSVLKIYEEILELRMIETDGANIALLKVL